MVTPRLLYLKMMLESSIAIWFFIHTTLVKGKTTTSCAVGLERIVFRRIKKQQFVQARVYEPPQFVALFQHVVVLKGGLSSGYKNSMIEKGSADETFTPESIQVSGTGGHNNKALQVEAVATSFNSYDCFLLQSGTSIQNWLLKLLR